MPGQALQHRWPSTQYYRCVRLRKSYLPDCARQQDDERKLQQQRPWVDLNASCRTSLAYSTLLSDRMDAFTNRGLNELRLQMHGFVIYTRALSAQASSVAHLQ